jgi:hypothetical protein
MTIERCRQCGGRRAAAASPGRCDSCGQDGAREMSCCVLVLCASCEQMHVQHCAYGKFEPCQAVPVRVDPVLAGTKKEVA